MNFRLMFQDEARFGRINRPKRCWCGEGIRPVVPCQIVREYTYAYGAVSPLDGEMASLILPYSNTVCMNVFLRHVADKFPNDYILMCVDGASYHKSKDLFVPENIELYPILAHTPELNPVEMIWDELREKFFKNELFKTISMVIDRLAEGLLHLMKQSQIVKSITGWNWILSDVLKTN